MVRPWLCTSLAVFVAGAVFGQAAAAPPAFEIAEVYVSAPSANPGMIPTGLRGSRYELRNATLVDLISMAYGLNYRRLVGGPGWLDSERFDVVAKAPPATPPETLRVMLQGLLTDRFQLKVHMATKPIPQYALTLGKIAPMLKEAVGKGPAGCQPQSTPSTIAVSCRNMTMAAFAAALQPDGRNANKTVRDLTGLKGVWDFDYKLTQYFQLPAMGADAMTIFDAIEKQLGLKLEVRELPTPVLVIDRVGKPTSNPPGAAESLIAPPPPEMVVEVKPPAVRARGAQPPYGVLLDFQNVTLKSLIVGAMGLSGEDPPLAGPDWLGSTHFDVVARPAAPGPPSVTLDQGALRVVERKLMEQRFKLAIHTEIRPWTVYALVAEKHRPKLKKAHRSDRSFCEPEAPRDPMLTNSFACQNTSMAQLAERLRGMGAMYIPSRPIVDATGIKGSWDFTLGYTGTFGPFRSQECPQPARPAGCLTVYEALEKELGLKLELQKRPMPVVLIDHVEQTPTDQ